LQAKQKLQAVMKRILLTMCVVFAVVKLSAQDISLISGTWAREGFSELSLYYIISGRLEKLATYNLQDNKTFSFSFVQSEEGYYVVGTGSPGLRQNKYTFYFKPGDRLNIDVDDKSYKLVGDNTPENIAITAWHDYVLPLEENNYPPFTQTYVDYFPLLKEKTEIPYKAERTGNMVFDRSFIKYRKFDMMWCAVTFVMTPRTAQPTSEDYPDYYKTIKTNEWSANTDIFMYPYSLLFSAIYVENMREGLPLPISEELISMLKNDTLKGEMALLMMLGLKDYATFETYKTQYGKYCLTDDQKARLAKETDRITALHLEQGVGQPAINFVYNDLDGNLVSLSDFKGKVVYVDVWATWCGPCRVQLPHLKRVEQEFRDRKDIVFLSVNTDVRRDIQKWKDFVAKEHLPGLHVWGNTGEADAITKLYQISGIPRFLLFDKQGNIVSVNAPTPSSNALVPLLNKLLK
jgi:thiol-disulfide isomerase/thioredoxin